MAGYDRSRAAIASSIVTTSTGSLGRMPFRIASGIFFSGGVSMVLFEMTMLNGKGEIVSKTSK